MTVKKLYAQRPVGIDGKHFDLGEEVKDVASEQIKIAERQGSVGPDKPGTPPPPEKKD
jgi:hypothetical protein